jgi:hypothetical protein
VTSQLRKELIKEKARKDKITNKAAYKWAEKNIILVNEKIDRRTVKRLSDAIIKFDQSFGPYKDKIPALAGNIERAEEGLNKVLTGRANDKKAKDMLARMSFLYSALSSFFGRDLPVILNTMMFAVPKENSDVRLDSLQAPSGLTYDPTAIRDAFAHALSPNKDEQKLLGKIYKKKNIPLLDTNAVANQMLGLTYTELQDLANIEKVPMVATPEPEAAPPAEEEPQKESANHEKKKLLGEAPLLNEAGIDVQKFQQLAGSFEQIQKAVAPIADKAPETKRALDAIAATIRKTQKSQSAGAWNKVKSLWGGDVEADIVNIYDQFKDFTEVWPSMRALLGDKSTEEPLITNNEQNYDKKIEIQNIINDTKEILEKALKKSFFSGRKEKIDPETFATEMLNLSPDEIDQMVSSVKLPDTATVIPTDQNTGEETEPTTGTTPTAPTGTTPPAAEPGTGTAPTTTTGPRTGQTQSKDELKTIAQDIGKKRKMSPEDAQTFEAILDTISRAGYNVVSRD